MHYIIIDSWNDVLYKVVAWSRNYYLAKRYFEFYRVSHELAQLVSYNAETIRDLYITLKIHYNTSVEDLIDTEIKSYVSNDGRITALTLIKYSNWFDIHSDCYGIRMEKLIQDTICKVFLATAPIIKYIDLGYPDDLFELLFVGYQYRLLPKFKEKIDMIYLLYFLLKIGRTKNVRTFRNTEFPISMSSETVFLLD